jgi:hypothetical protein
MFVYNTCRYINERRRSMTNTIKHIYATDAFCFAMNSAALLEENGVILEELHWSVRDIG